jgi:macrolide-specific efflux system membrane fusion protein
VKKFLSLILIASLALGGWLWWSKRGAASQTMYKRYRVQAGDLVQSVQATGNVQPLNRLELRPPVAGRVEQVLVQEGDYVKRGQTLAWISSSERAALLDAARAQSDAELKKWEELYKATPLLAPLSGQIISRDQEPGQSIATTDHVLVLSDHLVVKAQVDETDIARVHSGMAAEIRLDAYADQVVQARVGHIAYEARTVNNVTMYDVDVHPAKVPGFMRSGMTANVNFVTNTRADTLLLPLDAVQNRQGDSAMVLVPSVPEAPRSPQAGADGGAAGGHKAWGGAKADGQGGEGRKGAWAGKADAQGNSGGGRGRLISESEAKPVSRSVQLGLDDGQQVEVLSGLKEGDVVLAPAQALPSAAAGSNPFMPQRARMPQGARR